MSLHIHDGLHHHAAQLLALCALSLILAGCGSVPMSSSSEPATRPAAKSPSSPLALPPAGSGRGGYYMDDGPGDAPPEGLLDVPDAEPKVEQYSTRANRPYNVFGKSYTPVTDEKPFKQRGIGSWYGKKFHGQKTSSGEPYDMYKMTAAHPTLPIPSYVRVTNLSNGKQVVVRVNDRGPFHSGRIIDLSYTAALKLGYLGKGSSELEVERILPEEIVRMANGKPGQQAQSDKTPKPEPAVVAVAVNLGSPEAPRTLEDAQPAAPVVVPSPQAVSGQGYYLQLGAYSQAANALAARERLQKNAPASLPPMEVVEYGMFHRIYSGPFASRAEADAAARQLQEVGVAKPMIVQR
ncbi:MAG TPA: septal ring lytic transglycosylase RlpA family protein [Noviherbaspirillum sp.]|nr:septal ring lytic transglycosylase RlpA family protein [Noviherbaspirillum sp.]